MRAQTLHSPLEPDRFLVCGLGSLGQHCVRILKTFNVCVQAIERSPHIQWDILQNPDALSQLHIGDCRQAEVLIQADVQSCRAILLVTSDERVNLETAFAARLLNPHIRLVVRSAKENLNHLLGDQLGNYVAFEPTALSAPAFALAALNSSSMSPTDTGSMGAALLGFFKVGNERFQVVRHPIQPPHDWCNHRLFDLNTRLRRVLGSGLLAEGHSFSRFHDWEPNATAQPNTRLITVERVHEYVAPQPPVAQPQQPLQQKLKTLLRPTSAWQALKLVWHNLQAAIAQNQIQRVALLCGLTVAGLWSTGTLLFRLYYPESTLSSAFYATAVLLLGGYGDLFSEIPLATPMPWWLRLFGLCLTLAGTALIGVLYALLIEKLLSWRLQFSSQRPPLPQRDHVVVVGLGQVGQRVASLLQELKQPVLALTAQPLQGLDHLPLIVGNCVTRLREANLQAAKSMVALTEDEMGNLEMGLMAHAANPGCGVVLRTYEQQFTERIAQLFPYAQVLCAAALAAEAFVAAAFGENILGLFRIDQQTILVTEYHIEAHDTLKGLLLSEVAYGYGVVPIVHQRGPQAAPTFMPGDDLRLHQGDRLIALATITGLQQVERGQMNPRPWQVYVEKVLTSTGMFEGATEIARISGCELKTARSFMTQLPGRLPVRLFPHQAFRLVRRLQRLQVLAHVIPAPEAADAK